MDVESWSFSFIVGFLLCDVFYLMVGECFGSFYGSCVSSGIGSLFSILLLCINMDIAYCMVMTWIALNVFLMLCLRVLNVVSMLSIEGICVAALALDVMTISGFILQPLLAILSISGLYFSILRFIISSGILSLQYVNSVNCIVRLSLGSIGSPFTHKRSSLNLAFQWHLCWPHTHGNIHEGTVFSRGSLL